MDAPFVQDEEGNIYDVLLKKDAPSPDEKLLSVSLRIEIERALNKLTRREADIIRLFYGLTGKQSHALEEISKEFNPAREADVYFFEEYN